MGKKKAFCKKVLSLLLCAGMVVGTLTPAPDRVQAATGFELSAAELAAAGVPVVPVNLTDDSTFMNQYVKAGSTLNINSSFKRYNYSNVDGAGETLSTGTMRRDNNNDWYAQYKWIPNTAELAALNGSLKLVFEANITPDYHTHNYVVKKTSHWSRANVRINSGDWTYGQNDYGYKPNGNRLFSATTATRDDGLAQAVIKTWSDNPIGPEGWLSYNAYSSWDHDCGDPIVSGSTFYFLDDSYPYVTDASISTGSYVSLLNGDVTGTVTLTFSEAIRFADNAGSQKLQLELDAYYGAQSGKVENSDYPLYATLTSLEGNQMVFTFTIPASAKHIYIKGITKEQKVPSGAVSLLDESKLYLYDKDGNQISNTNLTSICMITDLSGNHMCWYGSTSFHTSTFDGVQPVLSNITMSGADITAVSAEPAKDWNANSGNNRYVYAGVGDKITFRAVFSEKINVTGDAKAVLSIEDGSGSPIKLGVKSVRGNTVTFEELAVTSEMKVSGERITITSFENMTVKDYCGNPTSTDLTKNLLAPAQDIALDPDAPVISTTLVGDADNIYAPLADSDGEYFTVPIKFNEHTSKTSSYSDISGTEAGFTLEMQDGDAYTYWWYVDSKQTVNKSVFNSWYGGAKQATTGTTVQTISDVSDDHQYFIHFKLDPNVDYNYTSAGGNDENGIYFNAKFGAQVSDWAGNAAEPLVLNLKHQVDTDAPEVSYTQSVHLMPDTAAGIVDFCADIQVIDDYAIREIWYNGEIILGDGSTITIEPVTIYKDNTTGSFSNREEQSLSYSYDYSTASDNAKKGTVTLNVYVVDYTGKTDSITGKAAFNFIKAKGQSYPVDMGTAVEPINVAPLSSDPKNHHLVTMKAPEQVSGSTAANPARTLMLIPDASTKDKNGNYRNFWMFDPWDWQPLLSETGTVIIPARMEYPVSVVDSSKPGDPVSNAFLYMNGYDANYTPGEGYHSVVSGISGRYYYMTGTVDPETHSGSFTDCDILDAAGSIEGLRNYIRDYYGMLDIYFVTTTSIEQFEYTGWVSEGGVVTGTWPKANEWNFTELESVVDAYQIYLANDVEYSVETLAITDAEGKDAQAVLDYQMGNVPAKTLDNVSLTFQITNETDQTANYSYGQNLLRFSQYNPTVHLYYTGSYRENSGGTQTASWSLEESSDGIYTVTIEEGTCTKNGWYRMEVRLADWVTGEYTTYKVGDFFMDATVADFHANVYYKEYDHEDIVMKAVAADLTDLEAMAAAGTEIVLGLDDGADLAEEGWSVVSHYLRFTTDARPETDSLRYYYTDDLVRVRVYNHTYNAEAGLDKETGLWLDSTTRNAATHEYLPYLAELTQSEPYGTASSLKLPFVEGYNLLVYEIENTNGEKVSHELVVNAYGKAEEWVLDHEISSLNGVDINSVKVAPLMITLDETTDTMIYEPVTSDVRFGYLGSKMGYYSSSYTFTDDLSSYFYLIDDQGNLSTRNLELRDENGELLDIDGVPPYYTAITDVDNNGSSFQFTIYSYDHDSTMSLNDVSLVFDPVYSSVLKGETDSQGRVVMPVPLALDENGELLMEDTDGDGTPDDYAVWESFGTDHNGIYRTKVLQSEPSEEERDQFGIEGYVMIEVWGTLKYDPILIEYAEANRDYEISIAAQAKDAYDNVDESSPSGFGVPQEYYFDLFTVDDKGEVNGDLGALNADGELGLCSYMPFAVINGYGAGKQVETIYSYYGYRQFYTTAPMIVEDGVYTLNVIDLFGASHDVDIYVDAFGELGIDVMFSESELTNQDVTITAKATGEYDEIIYIASDQGDNGIIDPVDPSNASITVSRNCSVVIKTEDGITRTVPVSNIDKTIEPVRIVYYDQRYQELDPALGAEEVTAVLVCDNEVILTTNGPDTYKFPAGSPAGSAYTFEYEDLAGNTGSITAKLGVDLPKPVEKDTKAPKVTVNLYASLQQRYHYLEEIYAPEDSSDINATLGQVRALGYKLLLSIADDSDVKIIVQPSGTTASADYASAVTGSTVDGVTCAVAGKKATLEVTETNIFDIYVIDSENNVTAITGINPAAIDKDAPTFIPWYTTGQDENGYTVITATFYPEDPADELEVITPLSADITCRIETVYVEEENPEVPGSVIEVPVDVTRYYHIFDKNGEYSFIYQDDLGNIGTASAQVSGLSTDAAKVSQVNWYGTRSGGVSNVPPEKSDKINHNITAKLRMNKPISQVELFEYNEAMTDGIGAQLESGLVDVSFTATSIDVVYSGNVDQKIVVQFTASASGRKGTYILPAIECIDKTAPVVTLEGAVTADDNRSVTLTFTTDEEALLSKDLEHGYSKNHTLTLKDAKPVEITFTDKAGNQTVYKVTENSGVDTTRMNVIYSASEDGSGSTSYPVEELKLDVGATLYVKVNKTAKAVIGETSFGTLSADRWVAIDLPNKGGLHVLTLTDISTGEIQYHLVAAWPKDNVAPVIELATETVLIHENDTIETMEAAIHQGVTVTDNEDTQVAYSVTGMPDTVEAGLYSLSYTAEDAAGNRITVFRNLYIMAEGTPILWINEEVGLPYGKVAVEGGTELKLTLENMEDMGDHFVIKYRKGLYTTGQMKYYATNVDDMTFTPEESGHYTIYIRSQNRVEFVTYIYVEE